MYFNMHLGECTACPSGGTDCTFNVEGVIGQYDQAEQPGRALEVEQWTPPDQWTPSGGQPPPPSPPIQTGLGYFSRPDRHGPTTNSECEELCLQDPACRAYEIKIGVTECELWYNSTDCSPNVWEPCVYPQVFTSKWVDHGEWTDSRCFVRAFAPPPVLPPPMSPPPPLPPPPSPPLPPPSPPGNCLNTCNMLRNGAPGVCDDGLPPVDPETLTNEICAHGTDCDDCGVRTFCSPPDCPQECFRRTLADNQGACMDFMLNNGQCNPQCNNRACGYDGFNSSSGQYGECDARQITELCLPVMQEDGNNYKQSAREMVFWLELKQFKFEATDSGTMQVTTQMNSALQWQQPIMFQSECGPALNDILSLSDSHSNEEAQHVVTHKEFINVPHLFAIGQVPKWPRGLVQSSYALRRSVHWLGGLITPPATAGTEADATCTDCVEYNETLNIVLDQEWSFTYFPFDKQTVVLNFTTTPPTHLYGCDEMVEQLRQYAGPNLQNILPADHSWLEGHGWPKISNSSGRSWCHVAIKVRRNHLVFTIKNILVLVLIVQAALIALRLDPSAPPLVAARFSIQMTAMLVVALRTSYDLSPMLGSVTELMWIDGFYMFQFCMVILALLESTAVHSLIRRGNESLAHRLDQVFRNLLPLVLYPMCTLGLILWAVIPSPPIGIALLALGIIATIGIGIWRVRRIYGKFLLKRRTLARELVEADETEIDDRSDSPLIREAFKLFDHDGSGDIGQRELHTLLELMYPQMPKNHRKAALHMVSDGNDDVIVFEEFDDVVLNWRKYAQENDPEGFWVGRESPGRGSTFSSKRRSSCGTARRSPRPQPTVQKVMLDDVKVVAEDFEKGAEDLVAMVANTTSLENILQPDDPGAAGEPQSVHKV